MSLYIKRRARKREKRERKKFPRFFSDLSARAENENKQENHEEICHVKVDANFVGGLDGEHVGDRGHQIIAGDSRSSCHPTRGVLNHHFFTAQSRLEA